MVDTEMAGSADPLEECPGVLRAHVVHDRVEGRGCLEDDRFWPLIAKVVRELGINEALLRRRCCVADERRFMVAAAATGYQPLMTGERTVLARLRKQLWLPVFE